ncbi:hypothetical protein OAG85_01870 [Verrucomicrobiales bacterium]|nr:hypothetical protein [bacterium]MDB4808654.1 hypothetical protein [Verrucomicrobiales bacterium]
MERHIWALPSVGNDYQISPILREEINRIRMKSRNEIQLDRLPPGSEIVHRRHHPFEASMAFYSDPNLTYLSVSDAAYISVGIRYRPTDGVGQCNETLTGLRPSDGRRSS